VRLDVKLAALELLVEKASARPLALRGDSQRRVWRYLGHVDVRPIRQTREAVARPPRVCVKHK